MAKNKSEENFQHVIEDVNDIVFSITPDGIFTYISPNCLTIVGYDPSELLGKPYMSLIHPDELPGCEEFLRQIITTGEKKQNFEYRVRHKDGRYIWHMSNASALKDENGKVISCLGISRDIIKLKQIELDQEATLKLLQCLNKTNPLKELMSEVTDQMRDWSGCTSVGIRLCQGEDYPYFVTQGFPKEFILAENSLCKKGTRGEILRDRKGDPILECMCGNVIQGRFDPSLAFFTENGSFWSNCTSDLLATTTEKERQTRTRNRCHGEGYESVALVPLRFGAEVLGLLQFCDSRKGRFDPRRIHLFERLSASLSTALHQRRDVELLKESERRFKAVADYTYDWETWFDPTGKVEWINPAVERMTGYTVWECLDMKDYPLEIVLGEDQELIKDFLRQGLKGDSGNNKPFRVKCKNGSIRWGAVSWQPIYDEQGMHLGIRTSVRDITERKQAEDALQDSENLLKKAEEISDQGSWKWDIINDKWQFSDSWLQIHGVQSSGISLKEVMKLAHPEDVLRIEKEFQEAIENNTTYDIEYRIVRQNDGAVRCIKAIGEVESDQQGKPTAMIGVAQDITTRKAIEEMLRKNQEQMRKLNLKLSSMEEQERKTIAEGIHDHLIQPLIFLDIKMKSMLDTAEDTATHESFKQMRTILADLINQSRTATFDLSFPTLYELGLCSAIEEWLQIQIEGKYGLKFTFSDNLIIQDKNINQETKVFVFKSLRELTTNVVKHAKASEINVTITQAQNNLILCVEDNGCGFQDSSRDSDFGLLNIREKAAHLNSHLHIDTKVGYGSKVTLTVPL